tara:strand:+ start:2663 stop:2791 length:129 start_codon:yes stop_codon:yes gene_type:complete
MPINIAIALLITFGPFRRDVPTLWARYTISAMTSIGYAGGGG